MNRPRAALLLAALMVAQAAQPVLAAEIAVPSGGQPYQEIVVKDVPMRVRLALGIDALLLLNPEPAKRAGLKIFPLLGKRKVQNGLLPGGEALARFNLVKVYPKGFEDRRLPTVWLDKPMAGDAEGIMSALALEDDRLVFRLGPAQPGARTYRLARKSGGSASMETRVGDEKLRVTLELNAPETIMNARAAAALLDAGMVRKKNEVGLWRPFPGVALPIQRLEARPDATLMGLPIINAVVRVTEAEAKRIDAQAQAGTSTEADDEDAIVVEASRKGGRRGPAPWVLLGRDTLDRCSTVTLDRPGKAWELVCRF